MDNHNTLRGILPPQSFLASLDIQDAYLHVPIRKNLRKFLAFTIGNELFFWRALPFGLAVAPLVFTKLLKFPLFCLREDGIQVMAYLDDWILWAPSETELQRNLQRTCQLLQGLGFLLNWDKSPITPCQQLKFLGFLWDTEDFRVRVPETLQTDFRSLALLLIQKRSCSRRTWERLIGKAVFICQILPQAKALFYPMARPNLFPGWTRDLVTRIPASLLLSIKPWLNSNLLRQSAPIRFPAPTLTLWTDASSQGWGALTSDLRTTQGLSSPEESKLHINCLEIRAIHRSLAVLKNLPQSILIKTDSMVAAGAIRKGGSKASLVHEQVVLLLDFARSLETSIIISHVPGHLNVVADALSRTSALPTEWELDPLEFQRLTLLLGHPQIDLFASPLNHRVPLYVTPFPHPLALATDAFTVDWTRWQFIYLFPPVNLLLRVTLRLSSFPGRALIITPWRPLSPWFPFLKAQCTHTLLLVPPQQTVQGTIIAATSIFSEPWTAWVFSGQCSGKSIPRRSPISS
jgi:ribonuclease HI